MTSLRMARVRVLRNGSDSVRPNADPAERFATVAHQMVSRPRVITAPSLSRDARNRYEPKVGRDLTDLAIHVGAAGGALGGWKRVLDGFLAQLSRATVTRVRGRRRPIMTWRGATRHLGAARRVLAPGEANNIGKTESLGLGYLDRKWCLEVWGHAMICHMTRHDTTRHDMP